MKELILIQSELKAPKNQFNAFGKYKYRSVEDILEAVKPLLLKYECTLTIEDEIKEVGGIVFVEATAAIQVDKEGRTEGRAVTAQAGIDINRKGMDIAQSFGSSSSYARKYALNGLFLIDDTKDPDSTNDHGAKKEELSPKHLKWNGAKDSIANGKVTIEQIKAVYILTSENEKLLLS
ncbi:MAG: ERF family protein [Chitinophagaceae bacterium]